MEILLVPDKSIHRFDVGQTTSQVLGTLFSHQYLFLIVCKGPGSGILEIASANVSSRSGLGIRVPCCQESLRLLRVAMFRVLWLRLVERYARCLWSHARLRAQRKLLYLVWQAPRNPILKICGAEERELNELKVDEQ